MDKRLTVTLNNNIIGSNMDFLRINQEPGKMSKLSIIREGNITALDWITNKGHRLAITETIIKDIHHIKVNAISNGDSLTFVPKIKKTIDNMITKGLGRLMKL